jgi:hypothetical protein
VQMNPIFSNCEGRCCIPKWLGFKTYSSTTNCLANNITNVTKALRLYMAHSTYKFLHAFLSLIMKYDLCTHLFQNYAHNSMKILWPLTISGNTLPPLIMTSHLVVRHRLHYLLHLNTINSGVAPLWCHFPTQTR